MSIGNVLIVEDDILSAKVLARAVTDLGYSVGAIAHSASQALADFKVCQPDIVLMDFNLGDGPDGADLKSQLFEIRHTPVVMITSVESEEEMGKILDSRPDAYVQKPIDVRELGAVLELVTYKFKKELELAELNRTLEQRVKERTEELDIAVKSLIKEMSAKEKIHQQLEKALKSEKQFGELKSKIITNLSHEFKTPLSSIRSSAQILDLILKKSSVDPKSLKHTERIQQAVDILTQLLVRILSVERDQDKLYHAEMMVFDLPVFIEGLKEELNDANHQQIRLNYEVNLTNDMIVSDPKLLRLIISNLVSNACKYSPEKSEVILRINSTEQHLSIEVEDFGIGMDQEDVDQIHYRFFRGKNVGSIEGTGIGMSIVKRSLGALFGKMKIESALNVGTKVNISIPLTEEEAV